MMMNRIYFFTGTGNNLKAAEEIGRALVDCQLVAIHKGTSVEMPDGYERLGFVFPSYAGGPPAIVAEFISRLELPSQNKPYLFAIVTYGGNTRDVLPLVANLFSDNGMPLDYTAKIMAYPNALPKYAALFRFFDRRTKKGTSAVVKDIIDKRRASVSPPKESAQQYYDQYLRPIHDSDKKYHINESCISCGICSTVCPAKNITIENGKPTFHHACESCLACIGYCPRHAITVGGKEQNRSYTNPEIAYEHIVTYYVQSDGCELPLHDV